ncbi:MAG: RluA family pseudouridine synthase, partial [Ruminococcus sp.]|nr:RluA family pseudouridine synthase [Ruminococcus sp.]
MAVEIFITADEDGKNLGEVLTNRGVSRRLLTRLKRTEKGITRKGETVRTIDKVFKDDIILLNEQDETLLEPNGELNVEVLYEDEQLIVFNKPPFMPVHPSIKHQGDTLGNFFAYHCKGLTFRPVNRLDRDTSGCVITAKNQYAAKALQRTYEKVYYAICHGVFDKKHGIVDAPIAREQESIIKRCVRSDGQCAVTRYEVLECSSKYSFLKLRLENGRTHQIRVHMSH